MAFDDKKIKKNPVEEKQGIHCAAHECPLVGDMSHSLSGGGQRLCQYHFKTPNASEWHVVTERIHKYRPLIGWRHRLLTNPIDYAIPGALECHFNPKFSRPKEMAWGEHLDRIQNYLDKVVLKGIRMDEMDTEDFFKKAAAEMRP